MISLLTWTIAAFAFSWVLAESRVSFPLRSYLHSTGPIGAWVVTLLECTACSGFHGGWIGQLLGVAPFTSWWMAAFYTCGSNLLLAKYIGMFEEK